VLKLDLIGDQTEIDAMAILEQHKSNGFLEINKSQIGLVFLAAITVAAFIFYWSGLVSLFTAWQRAEYSHGYIIPIIAVIIGLKRYQSKSIEVTPSSSKAGTGLVGFAVLLGLFGHMAGIADIVTYGILLAVAGMGILLLGFKAAFNLWPAWVYLSFMLPLPNFVYWPLSIKLQFLSSHIGVQIIKFLGVPVFLEGNIIDLGNYQLQVAEACSGLRYLFPLLSFGFLFSTLYRGPSWQKALIFLSSIPITILMNSARIGVIGFLVDRYGIAQAEGFLHLFEGWVIFAVCVLLLFLLATGLQWITGTGRSISEALDFNVQGLGRKFANLRKVSFSKALPLVLCLIIAANLVSVTLLNRVSVHPQRETFEQFPLVMGEWSGKRAFLNFDMERVLAADDYVQVDYTVSRGTAVNLLISYYRSQTEGSGIHSPEVCIPAGGWEVSKWEQATVMLKVLGDRPLVVNRAIIQNEKDRQLVYYWFEQRGRRMTNDYITKAYTVWDSVTRGRSDGALIRVITPLQEDSDMKAAERRLDDFLELAMVEIPRFVPP
jgi:exosortase D (VPLPA-CTERM-specific)